MRIFIYALAEPSTGEIRYVGQSVDPFALDGTLAPASLFISPTPPPAPTPPQCEPANSRRIVQAVDRRSASVQTQIATQRQNATGEA